MPQPTISTFTKYIGESRVYGMDFSLQPEWIAGETLSSCSVTTTGTGLTIGTPSITTSKVLVLLSDGVAGTLYPLLFTATTNSGHILEEYGYLQVNP